MNMTVHDKPFIIKQNVGLLGVTEKLATTQDFT